MRALKVAAGAAGLAMALWSGMAAAQGGLANGQGYKVLATPMPTSAPAGKVEVVEFFWYGCPHCYRLQKSWEPWLAAHEKDVSYRPQPAVLAKYWEIMARAHHAMVGAGGFDQALHHKFFTAIHEKNMPIQNLVKSEPTALYAMVEAEKGKPYAAKFKDQYESFSMGSKIAKDRELQKSYKLEGTPAIVVAGKYVVDPVSAGGEEKMVAVVDFLVRKAKAESSGAKPK